MSTCAPVRARARVLVPAAPVRGRPRGPYGRSG